MLDPIISISITLAITAYWRDRDGHAAVACDILYITWRWLRVRHSTWSCDISVHPPVPVGTTSYQGLTLVMLTPLH